MERISAVLTLRSLMTSQVRSKTWNFEISFFVYSIGTNIDRNTGQEPEDSLQSEKSNDITFDDSRSTGKVRQGQRSQTSIIHISLTAKK